MAKKKNQQHPRYSLVSGILIFTLVLLVASAIKLFPFSSHTAVLAATTCNNDSTCTGVGCLLRFLHQCGSANSLNSQNTIQKENTLKGTTDWQLVNPAEYSWGQNRFPDIEGYAWTTSAKPGDKITFSVSTTSKTFSIRVYRLGWYQGLGGRYITGRDNIPGSYQNMPSTDSKTGLIQANWPASFSFSIGSNWVTGAYVVKLTSATGKQGYIPFIVTSTSATDLAFIHAINTDEAYNNWGGKSLYDYNSTQGVEAFQVSFNRPFFQNDGAGNLFTWEYPMIRWLESQGYNVGYFSDVDVDKKSSAMLSTSGVLVAGHNEYWSQSMRDYFNSAIAKGINLGIFGADTGDWRIRYDSTGRIMSCYRKASLDPDKNPNEITVRFSEAPINNSQQLLIGTMWHDGESNGTGYPWVVTNAKSVPWLYANTHLSDGSKIYGIVGYEWDGINKNYSSPKGVIPVASSTIISKYGETTTHTGIIYTASSNATIFNASTIFWSWGLDNYSTSEDKFGNTAGYIHNDISNTASKQMMKNILNKFLGITPTPTPTLAPMTGCNTNTLGRICPDGVDVCVIDKSSDKPTCHGCNYIDNFGHNGHDICINEGKVCNTETGLCISPNSNNHQNSTDFNSSVLLHVKTIDQED